MLVKKQNIKSNDEWLKAFEESTSIYSYEDIKRLTVETIILIQNISEKYNNICSGWIAGKDSIVLNHIIRRAGIKYRPIMWRGVNEYPSMKKWIDNNKPNNLIEEIIDKYSLEFLEKHPDYLFCKKRNKAKVDGD